MSESPLPAELVDQAFDLIVAAHNTPGQSAQAKLAEFKARSPAHERALSRAEAEWQLLGRADIGRPTGRARLQLAAALKIASIKDRPQQLLPLALLVICLTLTPLFKWMGKANVDPVPETPEPIEPIHYATRYGKQLELSLADGSKVFLNWKTEISVALSSRERKIVLKKGEALFSVAKDPSRPFIVGVEGAQVRALGTEFSVLRMSNRQADVAVLEGVVEVSVTQKSTDSPPSAASAQKATLLANQTLKVLDYSLGAVQTVAPLSIGNWRKGMLVFNQRPLLEVLAELDRYTPYRIVPEHLFNADEPVTATYFIDQAEAALGSLASVFNLRVETVQGKAGTQVIVGPALPSRPNYPK